MPPLMMFGNVTIKIQKETLPVRTMPRLFADVEVLPINHIVMARLGKLDLWVRKTKFHFYFCDSTIT